MIKGVYHCAFRCRDTEETRQFYEDFLGLRFARSLRIAESKTEPHPDALMTSYEMGCGSYLAFLEVPSRHFIFKAQQDFDLHIALEVDRLTLGRVMTKGLAKGRDIRGTSDLGYIELIFLRHPNGYVVEFTAKRPGREKDIHRNVSHARDILADWLANKNGTTSGTALPWLPSAPCPSI